MEKSFRMADAQDLAKIKRLYQDAICHMSSQGIFQWDDIYPSQELLQSDVEKRQMYLLVCSGIIISAIVINDDQEDEYKSAGWKYKEGRAAVIHRLCVHPLHQGKGYGRESVIQAEKVVKGLGYTAVRLDAFSQNPSALRLYEHLGYERAGEAAFRKGRFFLYEKLLRGE